MNNISKSGLVDAMVSAVGDRVICLYTGHNTDAACAEDLASEIPMRCEFMYWDGRDAHSEPPVYVPVLCMDGNTEEDAMKFIGQMMVLSARMTNCLVSGTWDAVDIEGTDGMLSIDQEVSTDEVALVHISEGYERYL